MYNRQSQPYCVYLYGKIHQNTNGQLGLGEVTWSENGCPPVVPILFYSNSSNFLISHAIFDLVCSRLSSLTLTAPISSNVFCFSRLLKCLRSLYGKQCGPRSGSTLFSSILNLSVMLGDYLQGTTSADVIFRCIFFLALEGLIRTCISDSLDFNLAFPFNPLYLGSH